MKIDNYAGKIVIIRPHNPEIVIKRFESDRRDAVSSNGHIEHQHWKLWVVTGHRVDQEVESDGRSAVLPLISETISDRNSPLFQHIVCYVMLRVIQIKIIRL